MNLTTENILSEFTRKYGRKDLSFGCKIVWKAPNEEDVIIKDWISDRVGYGTKLGYLHPEINEGDYEILGHRLLLIDILNPLIEKGYELTEVCYNADGWYIRVDNFKNNKEESVACLDFDILKPYLDQQTEDFIRAIGNLLLT